MPLGSVAACSLPNHRDRVLHFTAHTLCNTSVYVYITHTCVWVLPHRRRILFEGRQCSAAMVRRRLLCHGEGWVLTIYLCLLYFRISIFLYFVFFALGLGFHNWIDSCLAIVRCSSLAVFSHICILYLFCISYFDISFLFLCAALLRTVQTAVPWGRVFPHRLYLFCILHFWICVFLYFLCTAWSEWCHGAGWFLRGWLQDWQTSSQMRLLTDWLADWPDITTHTTSFTLQRSIIFLERIYSVFW